MRVSYAIVFVSDMKRSVAFYGDVIGLPLKFCTQQPKDLFGAKMAEYLDPDGLAISVSEDRR